MTDLFISYSRDDAEFIQMLHKALELEGRSTWVDWDISANTEWFPEIEQAIDTADNAVFVLSPAWAGSPICHKELLHAVQSGKRLIPLQYRELDPDDIPDDLAKLNWIDFREHPEFQGSFNTLIDALDTDPERKRIHSWVLVRARRWEDSGEDRGQTLRGRELVEAETWLGAGEADKPQPTPLQTQFVTASRKVVNQRQRLTLAGVSVALVVAVVLGAIAWFQREIAEERLKVAVARQLAAQSQLVRADDGTGLERKLLLAVESLKTAWTFEGFTAWAEPTRLLPAKPLVMEHEGQVRDVKFSPDGKRLVSATNDNVRFWDASTGALLFETGEGVYSDVLFGPKGDWLALPYIKKLSVWDTKTGTRIGGIEIERHGGIIALAASPDNSLLAAGYQQNLIVVLDVRNNTRVAEFETDGWFSDLTFSPDSRLLAAGVETNKAVVWDVEQTVPVATLEHERPVKKIAFSKDGRWLATGGTCARGGDCLAPVVVWDVASWEQVVSLALGTHVLGLEFVASPDRLVAFGRAGEFRSWELDEWHMKQSSSPPARSGPVEPVVALDYTGSWIATAGYQNLAHIWKLEGESEVTRLIHDYNVASVDFAPDDGRLATGTLDGGIVRIWDPPTSGAMFRFNHEIQYSGQSVTNVDINNDGTLLATVGWDNTTRIWTTANGEQIALVKHTQLPVFVKFSPDGNSLAVVELCYSSSDCDEVLVQIADARTGEVYARMVHDSSIKKMAFSPDGNFILTGTEYGDITLWELPGGKSMWKYEQDRITEVGALAFSPDGAYLAAAEHCPGYIACEASIRVWSVTGGKKLQSEFSHGGGIRSLAFSPDGTMLATSSSDLGVRLWDPMTGAELWRTEYDYPLDTLLFTPDGKLLVGAGASGPEGTTSGVLRVFDLTTRSERYAIPHEWPVAEIAMTPDGKWLATATGQSGRLPDDRGWRARVFRTETGEEVARLDQPDALTDIIFSPDGRWLVTAGWDQSAAMWAWRPEDIVSDACARLNRNFSLDEWKKYFPDEPYRCTCAGLPIPDNLPIPQNKRMVRVTFAGPEDDKEEAPKETREPKSTCD